MFLREAKPLCASATTSPDIRGDAKPGKGRRVAFPDVLRKKRKADDGPPSSTAGPVPLLEPPALMRLTPRAEAVRGVASASGIVERILIGTSAGGTEARIRIGSGSLAGAEIRIAAIAGDVTIEAQLLTVSAGSRQTLAVAIDRISRRLAARKLEQRNTRATSDAPGAGIRPPRDDRAGSPPR